MISGRQLRTLAALAFSTLFILGCSVNEQLQGYLGSVNQKPALTVAAAPITEGQSGNLVFTLTRASTQEMVVSYQSSDGTALAGVDYTAIPLSTVTLAAGTTSATVALTTLQDSDYDAAENFTVTISTAADITLATPIVTVTITDDEVPVQVTFAAATSAVPEAVGGGVANLVVNLSAVAPIDVTVNYAVTGGTATGAGGDYTLSPGVLTFATGDTAKTIAITITNDSVSEPYKTVIVGLSAPSAAGVLGTPASHTLTIQDEEYLWTGATGDGKWSTPGNWLQGVVPQATNHTAIFDGLACAAANCNVTLDMNVDLWQLALLATYSGTFTQGTANLTAQFFSLLGGTMNVSPTGQIFSVTNAAEFTGGTINFGPGESQFGGGISNTASVETFNPAHLTVFNFVMIQWLDLSGWEFANVRFARPSFNAPKLLSNMYIAGDLEINNATVGIEDFKIYVKGDVLLTSNGSGDTQLVLNGATDQTITRVAGTWPTGNIEVAKTGGRVIQGSSITLGGSQDIVFATASTWDLNGFNLTADVLNGSAATGTFYKKCATLNKNSTTGTIVEHEGTYGATLSIADATDVTETDLVDVNQQFVVSVSPQNCVATTFDYATANGTAVAPGDYTAIGTTAATLPANTSSITLNVVTKADGLTEANENYTVQLSNLMAGVISGDLVGQGIILDDDMGAEPTISIADLTVSEGQAAKFIVSLSAATGQNVVFSWATSDGTATQPADYTSASGTATIVAGQTSLTLPDITTIVDVTDAGEKFSVIISSPTNVAVGGNDLVGEATLQEAVNKNIYRSIAVDASALATGAGNDLNISGETANFNNPLPLNIGVGDAIQYDSDGNGSIDSLAFIHARISNTSFTVKSSSDATPIAVVNDQDWSIYRAYTSITRAFAASPDENDAFDNAIENFDTSAMAVVANTNVHLAVYGGTGPDSVVSIPILNVNDGKTLRLFAPHLSSEVGVSQRHNGRWDTSKYQLIRTGDYSTAINFIGSNTETFVVDGLQIEIQNTTVPWYHTVMLQSAAACTAANNIIRKTGVSSLAYHDEIIFTNTPLAKAYNNIIYGFPPTTGSGIISAGIYMSVGTLYAYNNTIFGSRTGIASNAAGTTVFAKNNIVQNSGSFSYGAYNGGTWGAGGNNNISDDTSFPSGGSNNLTNATVTFVDAANGDFRLPITETLARGTGVDLSADPNLPLLNDAIGATRTVPWDRGALEAPTEIYRSLGPAKSIALATGAGNNLTIASGVATFSQIIPDNVGVGDAIEYDSDNNGSIDKIVFIHGRTNSTTFTVRMADGNAPADLVLADNNWSIFRAYTASENIFENNNENDSIDNNVENFDTWTTGKDLVVANEQWNIALYADGPASRVRPNASTTWVTSSNNYIRLYAPYLTSEVGVRQRHQGKYDTAFAYISNAPSFPGIESSESIYIDGIQIVPSSTSSANAIYISPDVDWAKITNNIIRGPSPGMMMRYGVFLDLLSVPAKANRVYIANNIMYRMTFAGSRGIKAISIDPGADDLLVINNNSFANIDGSSLEISSTNGTTVCQNNLAYTGLPGYSGTCDVSNNNLSYDASASGPDARINMTPLFHDDGNFDYRISSADTTARNYGKDLSADTYFAFNTDINGNLRGSDGAWDIGASEAANPIFRSVGPGNTSALAAGGSNALSISGGVAVFASALPNNIGVGDVIRYDTSNLAFIHSRISSTQYSVRTAQGLVPADVGSTESWSIRRAYTSLQNALTGIENTGVGEDFDVGAKDLATANQQWNLALYADAPEVIATGISISGWTTSEMAYFKLFAPYSPGHVGVSQRHTGFFNTTKSYIDSTATAPLHVAIPHVYIEGLQITYAPTGGFDWANTAIAVDGGGKSYITENILRGTNAFAGRGVVVNGITTAIVANNIIYGVVSNALVSDSGGPTAYYYNNTIYGVGGGGVFVFCGSGPTTIKNNIVQNVGGANYSSCVGFTANNNLSQDSTADDFTGSGNLVGKTVTFVNAAGSDFRLALNDVSAKGAGTNLASDANYSFNTDIAGLTRTAPWDIGAHELIETSQSILSLAKLTMVAQGETSFAAIMDYSGDINMDGSATLYYCNHTDSPGCDPLSGSSVAMSRYTTHFYGSVVGLSAPNIVGDTLNVKVVGVDPDGVVGSPAASTVLLNPILNISSVTVNEGQNANFVVSLTSPTSQAVTFNWATGDGSATTAGSDYTAGSGVATIAVGKTSVTLPAIATADDGAGDPSEYFTVTLSALVNASPGTIVGTAVLKEVSTIKVDFAQAAQASAENTAGIPVVVNLSSVSGANVVVSFSYQGTATTAADYTVVTATPLTIPAGQASGTILVNGVTDAVLESDETITFTMTAVTGGELGSQLVHTVYLKDFSTRIFNLQTWNERADGFNVSVQYNGDSDNDADIKVWFCNRTINAACDPVADGSSQTLIKDELNGKFYAYVAGLAAGADYGDQLAVRIVGLDADGISGSPLDTTLLLQGSPIELGAYEVNYGMYTMGSSENYNYNGVGVYVSQSASLYYPSTAYSGAYSNYGLPSHLLPVTVGANKSYGLPEPKFRSSSGFGGDVSTSPDGRYFLFKCNKEKVEGTCVFDSVTLLIKQIDDTALTFSAVTPDGSKVVYGRGDSPNVVIKSSNWDGTGKVTLLTGGANIDSLNYHFEGSADSNYIMYIQNDLFVQPVIGGARVQMNGALVGGGTINISSSHSGFLPDSSRVYYIANQVALNKRELFTTLVNGVDNIAVSGAMVANGEVTQVRPLADSSKLIFISDRVTDNVFELWSVNVDGTGLTKLSGSMVTGGDVTRLAISADSTRVLFIADRETDEVFEAYSVNVDGTSLVKISGSLIANGDVTSIGALSQKAVFVADKDIDGVNEFYSVSYDGTNLVQLNNEGESVGMFLCLGGGCENSLDNKVYYTVNGSKIYKVNQDGTNNLLIKTSASLQDISKDGTKLIINTSYGPEYGTYLFDTDGNYINYLSMQQLGIDGNVDGTSISDDGKWTIYGIDYGSDTLFSRNNITGEVFVIDGPIRGWSYSNPVRNMTPIITNNSQKVVYPIAGGPLRSANLDGTGIVTLSGAEIPMDIIPTSAPGRVVYIGDAGGVNELYAVNSDGSNRVKLSGAMVTNGDIYYTNNSTLGYFEFVTEKSGKVCYIADQSIDTVYELYCSNLDGTGQVKINNALVANGDVVRFFMSDDGQKVVFIADGSSDEVFESWYANTDGTGVLKMNTALVTGGDVYRAEFNALNNKIVYLADQEIDQVFELYSVNLNGTGLTKLNVALSAGQEIASFKIAPNGNKVVYYGDQDVVNEYELYSVNIDGTGRAQLNNVLGANMDVVSLYEITEDSSKVVYVADQDSDETGEMYSVNMDGTANTKISTPLRSNTTITWIKLKPGDDRVIYRAQVPGRNFPDYFMVELDGTKNVKIHDDLSVEEYAEDIEFSPNGHFTIMSIKKKQNGVQIYVQDL